MTDSVSNTLLNKQTGIIHEPKINSSYNPSKQYRDYQSDYSHPHIIFHLFAFLIICF